DAETGTASEQTILRVPGEQFGRAPGYLAVGGRSDDESLHVFHIPAGPDEFGRQPLEQFRVRRPLALNAEVFHRLGQADAETLLPETIDGHARGERVRRIDEPLRQAQAVFGCLDRPGRQDGRDARFDLLALLVILAA